MASRTPYSSLPKRSAAPRIPRKRQWLRHARRVAMQAVRLYRQRQRRPLGVLVRGSHLVTRSACVPVHRSLKPKLPTLHRPRKQVRPPLLSRSDVVNQSFLASQRFVRRGALPLVPKPGLSILFVHPIPHARSLMKEAPTDHPIHCPTAASGHRRLFPPCIDRRMAPGTPPVRIAPVQTLLRRRPQQVPRRRRRTPQPKHPQSQPQTQTQTAPPYPRACISHAAWFRFVGPLIRHPHGQPLLAANASMDEAPLNQVSRYRRPNHRT
jgi:hypothetical protein